MKYLVFSDVHGNLIALEKMLRYEDEIEEYIFLGDAVNYGPWSNECVELIDSLPSCKKTQGNHEEYFLQKAYHGTHPVARAFFDFCLPKFDRQDLIQKYSQKVKVGDWSFQHTLNDRYIFPDTEVTYAENVMIGHSHKPFVKYKDSHILCNVGSVGQNRTLIDMINYVILDIENNSIECKFLTYNLDSLLDEMKTQKYPPVCIDYYKNKKRFNQ